MTRRLVTTLALAAACVALTPALGACGGAGPAAAQAGSASRAIDAAGGTATTPGGASVHVPAGALARETTITIAESAGAPTPAHALAVGAPYLLGPEGTTFPVPVTVTLPFDVGSIPAGRSAAEIVIYTAPLGSTEFTALPTVLSDASHARATTPHFSIFVPVLPDVRADAGAACSADAQCAAGQVCVGGECVAAGDPDAGASDAGGSDAGEIDAGRAADAGEDGADTGVTCKTDRDCPSGEVCVAGACAASSEDAGPTDAGSNDAADPDAGDATSCTSNLECPGGEVCVGGLCVVPRGP